MTAASLRTPILLCILLVCTSPLQTRAAGKTEEELPRGILSVHIESDKKLYKVSDWIWLSFSIRNSAAQDYYGQALPPWGLFNIAVADANGDLLSSEGSRFGYRIMTAGVTYPANRDVLVGPFNDPYDGGQRIYWAALSFWGYKVTAPGEYTITAIPKNFTAVASSGPNAHRQFTFTDNSNAVKIQVVN